MLGVSLSFYKQELGFIPVHMNSKPIKSFNLEAALKPESKEYIKENLDTEKPLEDIVRNIPYNLFNPDSFEKICKIRLSSYIMLNNTLEDLFDDNPEYRIIRKIQSSMWRWGHKRSTWNELVHAYNAIRSFSLNKEDFKVRLDYTTSVNERGRSEYTRTFLDGVFAYLVYYKGKHVMTLGFSLAPNKKVLIQQIQIKERKGNRWLYKLPENYVEYAIDCFAKAFPKYKLYLVDGASLIEGYIDSYKNSLAYTEKRLKECSYKDLLESYARDRVEYVKKIAHMENDLPRLAVLYNNTGKYKKKSRVLRLNGLDHYRIDKEPECCYPKAVNKGKNYESSFPAPSSLSKV